MPRLHPIPGFVVYTCIAVAISGILVFYFSPRYGQKNVLIYITICSLIGSLSVMGCKGIGIAIKETFAGRNQFANWLTYVFIVVVGACIAVQMNYLNRALDVFNTSIVSPIYYVFFTSYTIVASAILFKEWQHLGGKDIVGNVCGFFTIIGAIFLLHAFKDLRISLRKLRATSAKDKEVLLKKTRPSVASNVRRESGTARDVPDEVQEDNL